jgi:hypothetical protein
MIGVAGTGGVVRQRGRRPFARQWRGEHDRRGRGSGGRDGMWHLSRDRARTLIVQSLVVLRKAPVR